MSANVPQRRFYTDGRAIWYIDTIWAAAEGLQAEDLSIDEVHELDRVCWFGDAWGKRPTCRAVIEHCKRMIDADLSYPVILGPNGEVLDGVHRIGKAMLAGETKVRAVRLAQMPEEDERIPPDDPRYEATPADER
jgi:hypothetical protein